MAAGFYCSVLFEMIACARMPAEHFSMSIIIRSHANAYVQVMSAHPTES